MSGQCLIFDNYCFSLADCEPSWKAFLKMPFKYSTPFQRCQIGPDWSEICPNLATLLPITFCYLHTKLPRVYKYIFVTYCLNTPVQYNTLDKCLLISLLINNKNRPYLFVLSLFSVPTHKLFCTRVYLGICAHAAVHVGVLVVEGDVQ